MAEFSMSSKFALGEPRVPGELVDLVLDLSDTNSLANCSLVCKSWLPATRYRVFNSRKIPIDPNNVVAFSEVLKSPHCTISSVIHSISLHTHDRDSSWITGILLPALALRNVAILFLIIDTHGWQWSRQRAAIISAGFPRLVRLEITSFWFADLTDIIEFIASFNLLEELLLYGYGLDDNTSTATSVLSWEPPSHLRLLYLDIRKPGGFVNWLLTHDPVLHLSSLTILDVNLPDEYPVIEAYLEANAATLQHLRIRFALSTEGPSCMFVYDIVDHTLLTRLSSVINLAHFYQLRSLNLQVQSLGVSPIFLWEKLRQIPSTEMRSIAFSASNFSLDTDAWHKVDDILTSVKFSKLEKITITTVRNREVRALLPGCSRRGLLDFAL